MAQAFPCEFCEISKNTFFTENHLATAALISWYQATRNEDAAYLCKIGVLKGTVMQIEKVLINDCLRISKLSRKFRMPTIYNFEVIYPWNLPFSWKVAYFLTVSRVFSVYKQNFKKETPEQVFPCEFCESFRTPFLQNTSERLLLEIRKCFSSAKL